MTLQSEDMGKLVAGTDGWIEWSGGPRPHPPATVVDVRLRDGRSESSIVSAFARWQHIQSGNDIIAFRPAHREAQPETDGGGGTAAIIEDALRHRLYAKDGRIVGFSDAADDILSIITNSPTPEGQTEGAWGRIRTLFVKHAPAFVNATMYEEASAIADHAAREIEAALASKGV